MSEFLSHLDLPVDERHCGPCAPLILFEDLLVMWHMLLSATDISSQAENMRKLLMFVETGATENLEEPSTDSDSES